MTERMPSVTRAAHQALAARSYVEYARSAGTLAKGNAMEALIWIGAIFTLIGVVGLVWCITTAWKARREGLDDEAMKARLQKVVAMNMAALAISSVGLMMVILGIFLS